MTTMQANADDVKRWRRQKRNDILQYAYIYGPKLSNDSWIPFADLWISPRTDESMRRCPFVRKVRGADRYTCTIYETRPQVCRDYPIYVDHMKFVDCEMLEPGDTDEDVQRFIKDTTLPLIRAR